MTVGLKKQYTTDDYDDGADLIPTNFSQIYDYAIQIQIFLQL